MKKNKTSKKYILYLATFIILFLFVNVVYAATSSKISFCDYSGVRRTFKVIGIIINLVKIIIPLILIATAMVSFFKVVTTGKPEDFKTSILQVVKQGIAGLVIFCIPGLLDFVFDSLVGYDTTGFTQCTNCLLDTDHCTIPTTDPVIYTD